jgi:hypothetical protein
MRQRAMCANSTYALIAEIQVRSTTMQPTGFSEFGYSTRLADVCWAPDYRAMLPLRFLVIFE